jgi:hypothetical protein
MRKIVTKLSKILFWDPGSGIRDPEKTYSGSRILDPGVKKAPDPGSRTRIRNTAYEYNKCLSTHINVAQKNTKKAKSTTTFSCCNKKRRMIIKEMEHI